MAAHVLVVATVTAASDDLLAAVTERARTRSVPTDFLLLMPASGPEPPEAMRPQLAGGAGPLARRRAEGRGRDRRPRPRAGGGRDVGARAASTRSSCRRCPGQTSRWLRWDVPYRIGALTDLPVTHVVAVSMVRPVHRGEPPARRERAPLGLLNVMAYRGAHPREEERLSP